MPSYAGKFLIGRPALQEDSFRQTVVLLLQHGDQGAFGLVVNRPVKVDGLPFPVFAGGPCQSQGLLMLHGHADWLDSSTEFPTKEVAPGVFLGDASCLTRISDAATEPRRVIVCLAATPAGDRGNWSPSWCGSPAIVPATGQLLFDFPAEDLWFRLVPPTIPEPSSN